METNDFRKEVEDFVDLYCQDYTREALAEYDFDDLDNLAATVVIEDMDGNEWRIPICEDGDGKVSISNDPNMWSLSLDSGGLYAYLWIEACKRMKARGN